MLNPMALSGRVVLVTGASSGIGHDTAALLSELGARLVLTARDQDRLSATFSALAADGHSIECFDLTAVEQIPGWLKSITVKTGPMAGLVHCAGVHSRRPLKVLDSDNFEQIHRINVTAAMMLAKGFRQKGCCTIGASIVLLSSVTGLVGESGIAAYAASKSAVLGLTRSLAMELAPQQIRVNCVAPGMVRTGMAERLFASLTEEQVASIEQAHPLGLGQARDVANAIGFLLSEASAWITGSVLVVDGGYTAR